jgi:hypothetical protein
MAEVYKLFGTSIPDMDYSEEAAVEMYQFESQGIGDLKQGLFSDSSRKHNGYAVGKHWMDAQVKMWIQGLNDGIIFAWELYETYPGETDFPHWWLDRVLPKEHSQMYRHYVRWRDEQEQRDVQTGSPYEAE